MQTLKTAGQRESCARVEDTYWPHSCIRSGYLALVTVSKKANSAVYGFFMASGEKIIEEHLGQALQILTPKLRQFCTTALNRISYLAWCWLRNQIKGFSGSLTLPYIHGQTCPNPPPPSLCFSTAERSEGIQELHEKTTEGNGLVLCAASAVACRFT